MTAKKTIQIACIPFTCRSIAGKDIEIGMLLGTYNGNILFKYKEGMTLVGHAQHSTKKDELPYLIQDSVSVL